MNATPGTPSWESPQLNLALLVLRLACALPFLYHGSAILFGGWYNCNSSRRFGWPLRFWFCKGGTFFFRRVRTLTPPVLSCCILISQGFPLSSHPLQQTPAIPQQTNHLK